MKRPINISPEIFKFLVAEVTESNELRKIFKRPIPYLVKLGILDRPDLLVNCVFELETGEEVIISKESAEAIKKRSAVVLTFIYNPREISLEYDKFLKDFLDSEVFDYVSRKKKK